VTCPDLLQSPVVPFEVGAIRVARAVRMLVVHEGRPEHGSEPSPRQDEPQREVRIRCEEAIALVEPAQSLAGLAARHPMQA
jgi:hypothetical protein